MSEIEGRQVLEIDHDLEAQEREWKATRVAWAGFSLVLLAGLSGLLGHGPLARAHAGERGSALEIEFSRLARFHDPERWKIRARSDAGALRLSIDRRTLEAIEIEGILPEPRSIVHEADRTVFVFESAAPGGTEITVRYQFVVCGSVPVRIGVEGGTVHELASFVFP